MMVARSERAGSQRDAMRFRGDVISGEGPLFSSQGDFVMVGSRPEPVENSSRGCERPSAPKRLLNLFRPDRERIPLPDAGTTPLNPFESAVQGEQFQVVNAPDSNEAWKLFRR